MGYRYTHQGHTVPVSRTLTSPSHQNGYVSFDAYPAAAEYPYAPSSPSTLRPPSTSGVIKSGKSVSPKRESTEKKNRRSSNQPAIKRFFCEIEGCTKGYYTSGHLARHIQSHSGEKPWACPIPDCTSRFTRHDNMLQHVRAHSRKVSRSSWPQSKDGAVSPTPQLPPSSRAASTPPDTSNGLSPNRINSSTHKLPRRRSQQEYYHARSPLSRPEYSGPTASRKPLLFQPVTTPNGDFSSPTHNYESDSYFPSDASYMSDAYEVQTHHPATLDPTLNTAASSWFFQGPVTPSNDIPLSPSSEYPISPSSEFFPDSTYSRDGFSSTSTSISLNDGTNPPFSLQLPTFGRQQSMSPLHMDSNINPDVSPANNMNHSSQTSWNPYPTKSFMDAFDVPMQEPTYPATQSNDPQSTSSDALFTSTPSMSSAHPMQSTSAPMPFTMADDTQSSELFDSEIDNKIVSDGMDGNHVVGGSSSLQNWDVQQQDWNYL